jgi:hypothetical protein
MGREATIFATDKKGQTRSLADWARHYKLRYHVAYGAFKKCRTKNDVIDMLDDFARLSRRRAYAERRLDPALPERRRAA